MLKQMRAQTPKKTLIPSSRTEEYLTDYLSNAETVDLYYLGTKYKNLVTITDDMDEFLALVDVAFLKYDYKWSKLFETTQLKYNPLWNVDATIVETHDIDKRHTEDTIGGADVTTENGAAPYDSETYHKANKSHTTSLEHTDEHDEDGYLDTITTTRHGNIGVTTAAQLIEGERKIADMSFLNILMTDIINVLTYPVFGGE